MALLLSTFLSVLLGIQATNNYDAEVYLGKCVVVHNMMKNKEPMNLDAVSDFVLNRIPITELREKIHSEVKGYDDIKEQLDIVFLYVKNCHEPRDFSFLQETN